MSTETPPPTPARKPQVFEADDAHIRVTPDDTPPPDGDHAEVTPEPTPPAAAPQKSGGLIRLGAILFTAMFTLASLAAGLWFMRFVSVALAREDWVGWLANGLLAVIALILVILFLKELVGWLRLARISRLRRDAEAARDSGDMGQAKRVVKRLKSNASGHADRKWALAAFRDEERHMTEPDKLLGLADRVLLRPADEEARTVIYESARRVAVVSAVVPITFVTMLFVLFENVRMVRRLAGAYGGRPGFFGASRLFVRVILHIAATGAVALTDDLFGQFLGQDMVRRLSRKLGEGIFNGALTARLGIAALDVLRPCPYIEAKPLRARHVVSEIFPELNAGELFNRAIGRNTSRSTQRPSDDIG